MNAKICRSKQLFHLIWCIILFHGIADGARAAVSVERLVPEPNYWLNEDAHDREQLTDQKTQAYPMWKNIKSVGWSNQRIVSVFFAMKTDENISNGFDGVVRLHVAKRLRSEIFVPARIDIYSRVGLDMYRHAGSRQLDQAAFRSNAHHWIDVEVSGMNERFAVVIHAYGQYIIMDEIEFNKSRPAADCGISKRSIIKEDDLSTDSLSRLKKAYRKQADLPVFDVHDLINTFGARRVIAWVDSPWSSELNTPSIGRIQSDRHRPIQLVGSQDEMESGLIGLVSTGSEPCRVRIVPDVSLPSGAVRPSLLEGVIAANGALILDLLNPLLSQQEVTVYSERPTYVWLSVDLRKMPVGRNEFSISIKNGKGNILDSVALHTEVYEQKMPHRIWANAWAYDDDRPIWNTRQQALKDLWNHGVNVFVIHHRHLPEPSLKGKWDTHKVLELRKRVEMYKGKGILLLYLEWHPGILSRNSGLSWLSGRKMIDPHSKALAIKNWAVKLARVMSDFGVAKDEWALYILDELQHSQINHFLEIATLIKKADPEIQIYANPICTSMSPTNSHDLEMVRSLVDIWQPTLTFAEGAGKPFFQSLNKSWWTYSNPPKPAAKAASPLGHYRFMSWRAWLVGANGTGFWSYSDTWGSSARDDFDGPRPDWAVVYEDRQGPFSSRRWEAFREGIEDFKLFITADKKLSDRPTAFAALRKDAMEVMLQSEDAENIARLKRRILNILSDN
jgi:hypothetical protein